MNKNDQTTALWIFGGIALAVLARRGGTTISGMVEKIKIVPDKKWMDSDFPNFTPIEDIHTMAEVRSIAKNIFGDNSYSNILKVFYQVFTVDQVLEHGYLIRPKGKRKNSANQFYIKKSLNISML